MEIQFLLHFVEGVARGNPLIEPQYLFHKALGNILDNLLVVANDLGPVAVVEKLEFKHLKAISEEVGRDWKMLGRHLGLDEITLEQIQQAYLSNLKEASFQVLKR